MNWLNKSILALLFLTFGFGAQAQYSLKYAYKDSLECYSQFYVSIISTATNQEVANYGSATNWWRFKLSAQNATVNPYGEVQIDYQKVYANKNAVIMFLANYLDDTLFVDTIYVPEISVVRLNYLNEIPNVGERLKLDIGSIYENGNSFASLSDVGINWDFFTLTCRDDTFNPEFFFVPYYADSPDYLPLIATYNFDTSVYHGFYIECTYSDSFEFDFSGVDGMPGKNGAKGRFASTTYRNGRWGASGTDGQDAMNLNVAIFPLESENDLKLKVVFIGNNFNHFVFLDPEKGKVKVDLSGGNGGRGGKGGDGAVGNPNARNNYEARGGNAADGGAGGNGGNGGELSVITNKAGKQYANLIFVKNDGGKAGEGGIGGKGGLTYVRENAGYFERRFTGQNGIDGTNGENGIKGLMGPGSKLWLVDDKELLELLLETESW